MSYNSERAHKLMTNLSANSKSPHAGVIMNDLLGEFHRGYPVNNLLTLLNASNDDIVEAGAWIASELGIKGKSLLSAIAPLLRHSSNSVRFSAIDCVLLWADPTHQAELASVVGLLEDPDPGVRWKAMEFLSRASREQLQSILHVFELTQRDSAYTTGLAWLLDPKNLSSEPIKSGLESENPILRKYAAVAARRSIEKQELLSYATLNSDADVKDFAETSLKLR
jgi:HEAT repeat protein